MKKSLLLLLAVTLSVNAGVNAEDKLEKMRSVGVALNEVYINGISPSCAAYADAVAYATELRDMKLKENDALTIVSQIHFKGALDGELPKLWLDVWQNFGDLPIGQQAKQYLLNRIRKEVFNTQKNHVVLREQEYNFCLRALSPERFKS